MTEAEPTAETAGEENHEDPWAFAGDDAPAPESTDDDRAEPGEEY